MSKNDEALSRAFRSGGHARTAAPVNTDPELAPYRLISTAEYDNAVRAATEPVTFESAGTVSGGRFTFKHVSREPQRVTRKSHYRGQKVIVTWRDGSSTAGRIEAWGSQVIRLTGTAGWVEKSVVSIDHVETDR